MDNWKVKMKKDGRCVECGNERNSTSIVYCSECRDKHTKMSYQNKKKIRQTATDICNYCFKPCKGKVCDICKEKQRIYRQKRRNTFITNGMCDICGSETINGKKCHKHYLQVASKTAFGTTIHWEYLFELLKKQNFKCWYSGTPLSLGINTSIEHKNSLAKNSNAKIIDNVVWADLQINLCKRDLSASEFIELCKRVVLNSEKRALECVEQPALVGALKRKKFSNII
jgi:predicted Rdx family selenoprotein